MTHEFSSIDQFISSFEVELINILYDYNLLQKFNLDAKKVILYFFVKKFNDRMTNTKLLFYHSHELDSEHELLKYYDKTSLNNFINKICVKIKKTTTRLFFISKKKN